MTLRLDHVALTVADPVRSRAFYARWFGVDEVVHRDGDLTIVRPPGGGLLAFQRGAPGAPAPARSHFGFHVVGVDDVLGFRARAHDGGLEEVAFQHAGGFAYCRVLDPDGHAVEVYAVG